MKTKASNLIRFATIFSIVFILLPYVIIAQNNKIIQVEFEIDGKSTNFSEINLLIYIGKEEIKPLLYVNAFIPPDFKNIEKVDICFIYKNEKYFFNNVDSTKFFKYQWVFGIDKKPFNSDNTHYMNKAKKIYFIKFMPIQDNRVLGTILKTIVPIRGKAKKEKGVPPR